MTNKNAMEIANKEIVNNEIRNCSLLSNDEEQTVEEVLKSKGQIVLCKKGDVLFEMKKLSNELFVIESGRVKIGNASRNGKNVLRAILGEGEIFGEMNFLNEKSRSDFAIAMDSDTVIKSLSCKEIVQILGSELEVSKIIFQILSKRIRKTERRLASIILKDARTRVVDFLVEIAEERGRKIGYETMIKNHFTHKDIANLTGTSRQTVTTTLNELRDKNIINFDRRRILIRDLKLLV